MYSGGPGRIPPGERTASSQPSRARQGDYCCCKPPGLRANHPLGEASLAPTPVGSRFICGLASMRRANVVVAWLQRALPLCLLLPGAGFAPPGQPLGLAAQQSEAEVSPEATPQISQVQPNQVAAGDEVTVRIIGRNFSRGVYVSLSVPAVRVVSTRRISATELETRLAIGRKAPPGAVSLYVSNPAGVVAEVPFTIVGETVPPGGPAAPGPEVQPSQAGTPEVVAVEPGRAARGSKLTIKITGKNFAGGAKVAFGNPGIRVLETTVPKSTELAARIEIANDAAVGKTGLFVVNPGDLETEATFEVAETAAPSTPAARASEATAQSFQVINLGEGINILQGLNKAKGTLTLSAGKLRYEEDGKEMFNVGAGDIKEIEMNTFLGVNTGTFHVILNSGKTFNFVPASLRPTDSEALVSSLRQALR